ncbi:MAG: tRNA (5-methylaminomethyl-2-thiouridine)(34)-methyltransferase MnmD [Flavobacteriales bacterium]
MSDLEVHRTADGSRTLFNPALSESYHSMYGAVTESEHVFIRMGLQVMNKPHIDLLEIGLGTGLNLLLTWIEAERKGIMVRYTAIEPDPVPATTLLELDHCAVLGEEHRRDAFLAMMASTPDQVARPQTGFDFRLATHQSALATSSYDLIYFDAFAPNVQPELWTVDRFQHMHDLLRPNGILVTYSAKGAVRRAMQQVGFRVERLPGPPGKLEMLRAIKPS